MVIGDDATTTALVGLNNTFNIQNTQMHATVYLHGDSSSPAVTCADIYRQNTV